MELRGWVAGGGREACFDEQPCCAPHLPVQKRLALRAACAPGTVDIWGQGRAAGSLGGRVRAGILGRAAAAAAQRQGAAVEGDSPYLRQLLLKRALPLERVQEHCNRLPSIINQLRSRWWPPDLLPARQPGSSL